MIFNFEHLIKSSAKLLFCLKSMKFFTLTSAFLFFLVKSQYGECGQGKVANKMHVCLKPTYIEGCGVYESEESCQQCQAGYGRTKNGVCDALEFKERQNKITGCLTRNNQDKSKCVNCADGFIRNEGKCLPGVKNCQKYENGNCIQCERNYSLVLNECRYNFLLGCKKASSTHSCLECEQPFELKGSSCFVNNCKTLNDYGCVTCQCGYYLHQDRTCRKFQQGCLRYQRGRCINCLAHYRLKGGICEIEGCIRYGEHLCIECRAEYVKLNGGCNFRNCADWSNGQCLSCQEGFRSQGGVCISEKSQICFP